MHVRTRSRQRRAWTKRADVWSPHGALRVERGVGYGLAVYLHGKSVTRPVRTPQRQREFLRAFEREFQLRRFAFGEVSLRFDLRSRRGPLRRSRSEEHTSELQSP